MSTQRRGGSFLVILSLIPISSVVRAEAPRPAAKRPSSARANKAGEHESNIEITHQQGEEGWQAAETANFRLLHQHARSLAEEVLRTAERTRTVQMQKWFGAVDADWSPKCRIYLYPSGEAYGEATGAPINPGGGHTDVRAEGCRVISRCVHVHGTRPFLLKGVIPHEVTHAVLAGRLSDGRVPRWADEGMAILAEAPKNIDMHLSSLPRWRAAAGLFSMRALIEMRDYPEPHELGVFYAQSVSLVEFLTRQKGGERFAAFVRDGERSGYADSLRKHYGWSFPELDRHWTRHVFYSKKVTESATTHADE
jgi:hypothetical protein